MVLLSCFSLLVSDNLETFIVFSSVASSHMLFEGNRSWLSSSAFTCSLSWVRDIGFEIVVHLNSEVTVLIVGVLHQVELTSEGWLHTSVHGRLEFLLLWASTNASLRTQVDEFTLTTVGFGRVGELGLVLDIAIIIDIIKALSEFGTKLSLVDLPAKFGSHSSESNVGSILLGGPGDVGIA